MNKLAIAAATLARSSLSSPSANAELLVGLTEAQSLVVFDSLTPSSAASVSVNGMVAQDRLVAIDRRPADGLLYGVAYNSNNFVGRVYTLDPSSGLATLRSTLSADPSDTTPTQARDAKGSGRE